MIVLGRSIGKILDGMSLTVEVPLVGNLVIAPASDGSRPGCTSHIYVIHKDCIGCHISGIHLRGKILKIRCIADPGSGSQGKLPNLVIIEVGGSRLRKCTVIYAGKDEAACSGILCLGVTGTRGSITSQTDPHTLMSLDGSALRQRHICRGTGTCTYKLSVHKVTDHMACPVHGYYQMIEPARYKDA